MRLFLSSYGLGKHPQELIKLTGAKVKIAIIGNASDFKSKKERSESIDRQKVMLSQIGLITEEIDLRKYFGKEDKLEKKLKEFPAVWVKGGNAFNLIKAMKLSGFDKIIKKLLKKDEVVYSGFSAGWCVLAQNLHGLEIVDDPKQVPKGYPEKTEWKGLGLINYSTAPHYKSDHPESTDIDKEIKYYKKRNIPYKFLRDGEVIVVNGNKEKVFRNKK